MKHHRRGPGAARKSARRKPPTGRKFNHGPRKDSLASARQILARTEKLRDRELLIRDGVPAGDAMRRTRC